MRSRPQTCSRARRGLLVLATLLLVIPSAVADEAQDDFNFSTGLFIERDYELAADEYRSFLKNHANHALAAKAQFQLGESLMRLEKYDEAIGPLELYVKRDDTEPDKLAAAYFRLGEACSETGGHLKAAGHYRAFLKSFPEHKLAPAARYWVGECSLRAERFEEAKLAFEAALAGGNAGRYEPYCVYGLGSALFMLKQYDAAARQFADVVGRFGEEAFAAEAALRLAQCYDSLKRPDDALKAYEELGRKFGAKMSVEALMGRAWAHYRKGQLDEAAELFSSVARQHAAHEQAEVAGYNAGSALFNLGRNDDALAFFERLAGGEGDYAAASLYWKGMCLLKLDRAREALAPLQAAAARKKYQARASFALGDVLSALGDRQKARQHYESVAARFPKDELADEALQAAAVMAGELGDHDGAVALARRLTREYPDSPLAAQASFLVGESLFRQGKFQAAQEAFAGLLEQQPEGIGKDVIVYKLAWCAYRQDRHKEAAELFQRVAKQHQDSRLAAESLYMAGKLLADIGLFNQARALYAQCVEKHPDSPAAENAAYAMALAAFSAKDWQEAAAAFEAFVKRHPDSKLVADAQFYLAESLFASKEFDRARACYQAVIALKPEDKLLRQASQGAAWCLREKGELKAAAAEFEKVAALPGESAAVAESLYWAGRCRMELDEFAKARDLFAKALAAPGAEAIAADVSYDSASCLLREKKYAEAVNAYSAFMEKFPNSGRRTSALYDLAWAYQGKGDEEAADECFRQVAEGSADVRLKADALFRLAEARYTKQDYGAAAALYAQIVPLEGVAFLDKVHYKFGWSYEKLGKWKEALEAYTNSYEERAEGELAADAAVRAGVMLQQMGEHERASEHFSTFLKRPGLEQNLAARARFRQAESLRQLKNWAAALPLFRVLAEPQSGFEEGFRAHYGVGVCSFELKAYADARGAFEQVIQLTETETAAKAQLALGEILYAQGKFPEAAREFLKANFLYGYPQWKAQGLLRAGQSYEKAGDKERAEKYLKLVIERFPDSEAAAEARKLLGP